MLILMYALARRIPLAERLIAWLLAPAWRPARTYRVRALLDTPNSGADLIIRGVDGVHAVTHRVTRAGMYVIILATVFDGDGERFRSSPWRELPACLPGASRAAEFGLGGRWSIAYPIDTRRVRVDPFPARTV